MKLFAVFFCSLLIGIFGTLEHASVQKTIDLNSQLVRETVSVSVSSISTAPVRQYTVLFSHPHNLAFFEAKTKKGDILTYTISKDQLSAVVDLNEALTGEGKQQLVFNFVYTHLLSPLPKEVAQNEHQKMVYNGDLNFISPYATSKMKTVVNLAGEIISYTKRESLVASGTKLTYGPINTKTEGSTKIPIRVHFTNNSPFLTTEKLVRSLEISHWGNNLAFEEIYDTIHSGALLKGYYSRIEYDRSRMSRETSGVIEEITFQLPKEARDVYYGDIIGNISTSHFHSNDQFGKLEISPRFPLFGGWRTKWTHGYNVDLSSRLMIDDSNNYVLSFDFVAPYQNAVIDDFVLRVTLPEGATNIKFASEKHLDVSQSFESIQTYLDTYGRTIFVAKKKNVVNEHTIPVTVTYSYPTSLMAQEPLLLIAFYFVLFLASMFFLRLDFSLSNQAPVSERIKYIRKLTEDHEGEKKSRLNEVEKEFQHVNKSNAESFKNKKNQILDGVIEVDKKYQVTLDELKKIDSKLYSKANENLNQRRKRVEELRKHYEDATKLKAKDKESSQISQEIDKVRAEYFAKTNEFLESF